MLSEDTSVHYPHLIIVSTSLDLTVKIWGVDGWQIGTLQQGAVANSAWGESLDWEIGVDDEGRKHKHENDSQHIMNTIEVNARRRR